MAWRDDISEGAQSDLDTVFSQAALLARTLLMRNREFFPFAATIGAKGAVGLSTPVPDATTPTVHDVIEAITAELRRDKAGKRAYAIVALARTADGGEAVRIELEHKEGVALLIGMPIVRGMPWPQNIETATWRPTRDADSSGRARLRRTPR